METPKNTNKSINEKPLSKEEIELAIKRLYERGESRSRILKMDTDLKEKKKAKE